MRIKARASVAVALVATSCAVAACGGSDSGSGGGGKDDLKVSFIAALVNDSYFVTVKCGAEAEAKKLGVELNWNGPTSADVPAELKAVNAAGVTNPDAMVIAPFSNTGFGGAIRPLMKRGVPVALSGQTVEPADGYVTYITDFEAGGNSLAEIIQKLSGGKGTMGIVATSTGNKTDSDRYTGLTPLLEQQSPDLKVLKPQYANNSSAKAASITASLIRGNPDMNIVYATSGPQAVGAASAISAAKAQDKIKLISFDSNEQQIKLLQQGRLAATVAQSPYQSGALTVKAVVDYVRDNKDGGAVKASDRVENTPTKLLTPDNVDAPESKQYQYLNKCSDGATQGESDSQ